MITRITLTKFVVIGFLIFFTVSFSAAQGSLTPTPAPSKTPTPDLQAEATEGPDSQAQRTEPWTQTDLSILTGNVQRPNGLTWLDDHLYTVCSGDSTVYELDATSGATRTFIWGVRNAHTLYVEKDNTGELTLWVPDFQTNSLLHIDRNGVDPVYTELSGPWGINALNDQEFLITNLQTNTVMVVSRDGEGREILNGFRAPTGIATDENNIYIANTGSARRGIEWVSKEAALNSPESTSGVKPLVTGLQNTTGVVMAPDGYLYFAYSLGTRGVVGRVNPAECRENGCTNNQVDIVIFTELAAPLAGLTVSPDMRLYVHTIYSPDIYWVQLDGPVQDAPEAG